MGSNQREILHLVPSTQHPSGHYKAAQGSHLLIFRVSLTCWLYTFSRDRDHLNRRKLTATKPQVLPHCHQLQYLCPYKKHLQPPQG